MLLGAHLSISGGYHKALEMGKKLGCTVVQIFLKNQRRWSFSDPADEIIEKYINVLNASKSIKSVLAHGSYLYNFSSVNEEVISKSVRSLLHELKVADLLGIKWVIIHPGSHMGQGTKKGLDKLVSAISRILSKHKGNSGICIETNSGFTNSICSRFDEIGFILSQVRDERVGVCFDTCHVHSTGYDLGDQDAFNDTMKKFDISIGMKYLKVIHLNDSKYPLGSGNDRHMHIGEGTIGEYCFKRIMADEAYVNIPKVIETPKGDDPFGNDLKNLEKLKSYIVQKGGGT